MYRYLTKGDAGRLAPRDRVRILVNGCGDVDGEGHRTYKAGEIVTVDSLAEYGHDQGLAITVVTENGVVNVFDARDHDGRYPFERIGGGALSAAGTENRMMTEFEGWVGQLAKKLGRPAVKKPGRPAVKKAGRPAIRPVSDDEIAELLGIHRNRVADFRRGHSLHTPPQPMTLDRRTRLAMAAILAGLEPWTKELEVIHGIVEDNSQS